MNELNPCPFCDGTPVLDTYYSSVYERIFGYVECKACGVKIYGKKSVDTYDVKTSHPNFPRWKKAAYRRVEQGAVEAWNHRA